MKDFEFKIGLIKDEDVDVDGATHPPKIALIHQHLKAILGVVELTRDGKEVVIDGFRFLGEEKIYPLTLSSHRPSSRNG